MISVNEAHNNADPKLFHEKIITRFFGDLIQKFTYQIHLLDWYTYLKLRLRPSEHDQRFFPLSSKCNEKNAIVDDGLTKCQRMSLLLIFSLLSNTWQVSMCLHMRVTGKSGCSLANKVLQFSRSNMIITYVLPAITTTKSCTLDVWLVAVRRICPK